MPPQKAAANSRRGAGAVPPEGVSAGGQARGALPAPGGWGPVIATGGPAQPMSGPSPKNSPTRRRTA